MTDSIPTPDPTLLTTEALMREIGHLRELMETKISESDRRYQQRFEDQTKALDRDITTTKEAVGKAEQAAEKRYEAVNEKVVLIASRLDTMTGRGAGGAAMWGYIAAAVFLLIAVVTFMNTQAG